MDEEIYENPNKKPENAEPQEKADKPTKAWYLLPLFVGFVGGIVGYFIVKDKDKKMATYLLIAGCIISFIGFMLSGFFVLAYYGLFAPSGYIGPTARGFGGVSVISPWDMKSNGELSLKVENSADDDIQIKKVYVNNKETISAVLPMDVVKEAKSNIIIVNSDYGGNTGSNYAVDLSIEYCLVKTGCSESFKSNGTISGTYS